MFKKYTLMDVTIGQDSVTGSMIIDTDVLEKIIADANRYHYVKTAEAGSLIWYEGDGDDGGWLDTLDQETWDQTIDVVFIMGMVGNEKMLKELRPLAPMLADEDFSRELARCLQCGIVKGDANFRISARSGFIPKLAADFAKYTYIDFYMLGNGSADKAEQALKELGWKT